MKCIFRLPLYPQVILSNYLNNRYLTHETDAGTRRRELTGGAAQGSVFGPKVWNIFYVIVTLTWATIIAIDVGAGQVRLNQFMCRVTSGMVDRGLEHIRWTADKAAAMTAFLSKIMPFKHGPRPCARCLLTCTAESILLNGAEFRANIIDKYRKRIAAMQRRGFSE